MTCSGRGTALGETGHGLISVPAARPAASSTAVRRTAERPRVRGCGLGVPAGGRFLLQDDGFPTP